MFPFFHKHFYDIYKQLIQISAVFQKKIKSIYTCCIQLFSHPSPGSYHAIWGIQNKEN